MNRNRLYLLIMFCFSVMFVTAQVTTNPSPPYDDQSVTITFNAAEGSQGLMGYTGDIYAHTGVITDQSTSTSDWKYVKSDWGVNIEACKLTSIGNDQYTLEISPSIRDFYGVPAGEKIEKIAFVFRSSDSSLEGKTSAGGDIFVDVSTNDLTVTIDTPIENSIYAEGASIPVEVSATNATGITIYVNDVETESVSVSSLSSSITAGTSGSYTLKAEATDGSNTVSDEITFFVRGDVVNETMPVNLKRGVNVDEDQSVTFVLFAPDKEFVHLIGSFNNWQISNDYMMKKDGDYFWLTVSSLDANTEYAFQFFIDGSVKIADPYTNKTLDPLDQYITEDVYPGLMTYPNDMTSEIASTFIINKEEYSWQVSNFSTPDVTKMVVYELHIRDFTDNGDIKTVTDSIEYFKELGVNAIELMPFNEFEGNDSWGYNPSFYFATDKAYGTENDYKEFIDVCHQNGIAVLMDMVLNHSFGQSPFARMYLDGGKPAANNPWYNRDHNMQNPDAQWGYDFNHESADTQELVDSICAFWMGEFKLDGFRFDFTKGFTNTSYPADSWASDYDQSRINILERMVDQIWSRKSDAIVAFEHLSDNTEEKILANHGILLWGNHNHNFNQATMGYDDSDFSWASYKERGWNDPHLINYMESHDEERIMYKNEQYGDVSGDYNVTDLSTALDRTGAAAAFLLSIPGPKMIWQFGELGYDYSINTCEDLSVSNDCRLSRKPVKWEYYEDDNRKDLFDIYRLMINLKKTEPVFSTTNFSMSVASRTKRIELNLTDSDVRLIGNFDVVSQSIKPNFNATGYWYSYFDGDSVNVSNMDMPYTLDPGQFILFSKKKLNGFIPHTSIGDPTYFKDANIAPNPTSDKVNILTGSKPLRRIKVTSITGALMLDRRVDVSNPQIDISPFPKGIYLIHLIGDNDGYRVFKLLKK